MFRYARPRTTKATAGVLLAVLLLALGLAACGGSDTGGASDDAASDAPAATGSDATDSEGTGSDATGSDANTATAGDTGTEAGDTVAAPEGEPILVGVNVETSGPANVQGTGYANAAQLRADRINAAGGVLGRPIELVIVDNETSGESALLNTQELVDKGIVAMIGPGTSPTTMGAIGAILESGIPTISMGSAGVIVNDPDSGTARPNVFKTAQDGSLMATGIADHILGQGLTKVGLLVVNNPYGEDGRRSWEAVAAATDIELVAIETFEASDVDMTVQLTNIEAAGAEAVVVWAIPPGAPTVRRNAVENLGLDLPMYHDAGAGAEIYLDLAGEAANGAFVMHPKTLVWDTIADDDPQADALREFGNSYVEAYGAMSGFAGYSWDALGLIVAGIEASGSTEPADIVAGIEGLGVYTGVTGTFEITPENHQGLGEGDLIMLTVEDGTWVVAD